MITTWMFCITNEIKFWWPLATDSIHKFHLLHVREFFPKYTYRVKTKLVTYQVEAIWMKKHPSRGWLLVVGAERAGDRVPNNTLNEKWKSRSWREILWFSKLFPDDPRTRPFEACQNISIKLKLMTFWAWKFGSRNFLKLLLLLALFPGVGRAGDCFLRFLLQASHLSIKILWDVPEF